MYQLIISVDQDGKGFETVLDRKELSSTESEKLILEYRRIYSTANTINICDRRIVEEEVSKWADQ